MIMGNLFFRGTFVFIILLAFIYLEVSVITSYDSVNIALPKITLQVEPVLNTIEKDRSVIRRFKKDEMFKFLRFSASPITDGRPVNGFIVINNRRYNFSCDAIEDNRCYGSIEVVEASVRSKFVISVKHGDAVINRKINFVENNKVFLPEIDMMIHG